jgi:photosystem II stability/assembly factor-like uncharacterized protein
MPDLYAVGPLGNLLLHSDGSGTWTPITLPTGSALTSVWVAANGDVIAGGANGQIVHLY